MVHGEARYLPQVCWRRAEIKNKVACTGPGLGSPPESGNLETRPQVEWSVTELKSSHDPSLCFGSFALARATVAVPPAGPREDRLALIVTPKPRAPGAPQSPSE